MKFYSGVPTAAASPAETVEGQNTLLQCVHEYGNGINRGIPNKLQSPFSMGVSGVSCLSFCLFIFNSPQNSVFYMRTFYRWLV